MTTLILWHGVGSAGVMAGIRSTEEQHFFFPWPTIFQGLLKEAVNEFQQVWGWKRIALLSPGASGCFSR